VAERSLLFGRKIWFSDARTPVRRMGVSQHPEEGVVVVSLWQGDVCTGTFRLPMADAPRLISELADALGAALPGPSSSAPTALVGSPATARQRVRQLVDRLLDRVRGSGPPTLRRVK
jgi:hypothetical protein